jgi:hypothetical protein
MAAWWPFTETTGSFQHQSSACAAGEKAMLPRPSVTTPTSSAMKRRLWVNLDIGRNLSECCRFG